MQSLAAVSLACFADLANLGATVLRVETEKRIDTLRFLPPWKGDPGVNNGHTFANMNQSKQGHTFVHLGTTGVGGKEA